MSPPRTDAHAANTSAPTARAVSAGGASLDSAMGAETTLRPMADKVDSIVAPTGSVRTDDWPVQATDAIVKVVGTAHDKITGPVTTVARALAYGLLALTLGTTAGILGIIGAGRFLDAYLPDAW